MRIHVLNPQGHTTLLVDGAPAAAGSSDLTEELSTAEAADYWLRLQREGYQCYGHQAGTAEDTRLASFEEALDYDEVIAVPRLVGG